ncbi:Protocadherin-11 Y-linked [Fasciola gigantica]|uniref:Protocadherin-11 Y-linked n=1 Tax=Fasciola gigantica TaxID=46835 RepID=A0A504Z5S1_FASGI|nr:Protocadherin-11 Y-linked [Fasciola gigantica]
MMSDVCRNLVSSLFVFYGLLSCAHTHILSESRNSGKEFTSEFPQANTAFPITRIYVIIPEELPPGSIVIDLNANPLVKNIQTAFESSSGPLSFQYRLMNTYDSRLFRVGSHSGRMTVAARLDRELLCTSQKAQFCCNTRNALPSSLFSDPNWKEDNDSVAKSQRCHLIAHISIQSNILRSGDAEGKSAVNQMALIYVYIRLDDVNDHTPQFTTQSNSLNVAEDTPVGTVLQYYQISDPDAGVNGLDQVKLDVTPISTVDPKKIRDNLHAVTLFKSNPFETQVSRDGVSLLLVRALDRELVAAYDVVLTAIDGDRLKPKFSQLNLRIHVTDANDNPPIWILQHDQSTVTMPDYFLTHTPSPTEAAQNPRFNVTVPENTQVGALIYWLQAKDPDVGDNARLQYAIDTSAPGGLTALDYFSVQPTTGEVRLRSQLDYDSASLQLPKSEMEVPVIVRDSPRIGRQLSAKATLVVHITDVNDMYPVIVASPLQPIPMHSHHLGSVLNEEAQTTFGVWENRPPGQPIASISVNDPDTGDGGTISCSVQSDFFTLTPENEKSEYFSEFPNQPVFASNKNSMISTDASYRGPITYHLLSFQRLDREAIPKHQIVLTCRDHDRARPLVSTQRLDIEVLDENDNPPEFSSQVYYLLNPPSREFELDRDSGKLTVRTSGFDPVHQSLTDSGKMRVSPLDREQQDTYELTVVAEDGGNPPRRATTVVHIGLSDVNDNAPQFSYPTPHGPGSVLNVSCEQLSTQLIARVYSNDSDSGRNGEIEYSIVRENVFTQRFIREAGGDELFNTTTEEPKTFRNSTKEGEGKTNDSQVPMDAVTEFFDHINVTNTRHVKSAPVSDLLIGGPTANHFEINSHNGQLFLIHPITDCSRPAEIRLLIRAKDGGVPSLSSTAMLTVYVRPTEKPIDYGAFASQNEYRRTAQSGLAKGHGSLWMGRNDMERRTQRKLPTSPSTGSTSQLFSSPSHWSAIVGLIVAMVLLVLLLCIMLFVLRRKLVGEESKIVRKNHGPQQVPEKHMGTPMRRKNDVCDMYYKSTTGSGSVHDMGTCSPRQNSMSPATLVQLDELNCSSMSLVPNQPGMVSAHYFCTVPNSATALTLNTGEVAVLHHENEGRIVSDKTGNPNPIIYETSNGEFYSYEAQPQGITSRGKSNISK